jgi:hypothetical protein
MTMKTAIVMQPLCPVETVQLYYTEGSTSMRPSCSMETTPLDDNEGSHLNAAIILENSTIKCN